MKVGIVRDNRYLDHKPGNTHPEHPRRLKAVYDALDRDFHQDLATISPEPTTLEALEMVHTTSYIDKVMKTADQTFTNLAPDTPASSMTYLASWLAVGGCLKGLEGVLSGRYDACFALVRPPGHHARVDGAGGFCIFNNLGITAKYAIMHHHLERVLIIDWDIHHGNGINDFFHEEEKVLYFSTHDLLLYPYTGNFEDAGKGAGEGYTVNLPLSREMEDEDFLSVYNTVMIPLIERYRPQLILVAAGFDGHHDDPLGKCRFTAKMYYRLTALLLKGRKKAGEPPLLLALEGGYQPSALARCVGEVLACLTHGKTDDHIPEPRSDLALEIVQKAKDIHKKFGVWVD
ncbi:MAG: histone deacetylase [Deltaproteobacteria bacterium]|nr:histone deacetylase [Deltaproteobacteria bacterium]